MACEIYVLFYPGPTLARLCRCRTHNLLNEVLRNSILWWLNIKKSHPPTQTINLQINQAPRTLNIGILSVEWGCVISQVMKVLFQLWVPPKLCPAIVGCCFAISWHLLFEMSGWSLTFGSSFAAPKLRSFVVFQNLQNVDQAATNLTKLPFFTWPTKWNHWRVA